MHVNEPKWRVGARGLFSSRRKGNIPPTSGSIIGSLSSLPSLHTLISQAEGRGKSQAGRLRLFFFFFFDLGGGKLHTTHIFTCSSSLLRCFPEASPQLQGNRRQKRARRAKASCLHSALMSRMISRAFGLAHTFWF